MGNKNLFDDDDDLVADEAPVAKKRTASHLDKRDSSLYDLTSGSIEDKSYLWVDPASCKMWDKHDRDYSLLSIDDPKCMDLVEGIKSQGRQEIPAVVRALKNDPDYKYEVIIGARRHWAITWLRDNNYPSFKYCIEVKALSDEEAFRLNDMENRDREDVSDYERAVNYKRAIALYYNGSDSQLAERIGYTRANLSYLLALTDLPKDVISAFGDPRNILINYGRKIKKAIKSATAKKNVIEKAKELSIKQKELVKNKESILTGKMVLDSLLASAKNKVVKAELIEYKNKNGESVFKILSQNKKQIKLNVSLTQDMDKKEMLNLFSQLIDEAIAGS